MKVLHLTLKKKWFDMIASGEKKEEYREIKLFWITRFCNTNVGCMVGDFMDDHKVIAYTFKDYTHIKFARGGHFHPSIQQILIELAGIKIGFGNPKWGAELDKKYFVIKLGEIIKRPM